MNIGRDRVWAGVDLALANRVSPYEWLVVVIGAGGVMISLHFSAAQQLSPVSLVVRASATAMVVGLLFAVRDYDLNRPQRVVGDLLSLRRRFGFTVAPDGILAARALQQRSGGVDWAEIALVVLVFASAISIAFNVG